MAWGQRPAPPQRTPRTLRACQSRRLPELERRGPERRQSQDLLLPLLRLGVGPDQVLVLAWAV